MDGIPEGMFAAGAQFRRRPIQSHRKPMQTHAVNLERRLRIRSSELDGVIAFTDCDEVMQGLRTILRGWQVSEEADESLARAVVRLRRTRRGYRRASSWVKTPSECREAIRKHHTDALFGVYYDLLGWYAESQKIRPCLHSAAVKFGSSLVVFPNTTKAGKTTLTIELAINGYQVFCDDWLPILQPGSLGLAMGILPWLRLPAPAQVREDFKRFLNDRRGPGNRRWVYVNLKDIELARQGEQAPVRGLVLLDRTPEGRARLSTVTKDRMLSELIEQNYARQLPAMGVFDQLHALTETADCYRLQYASVREAAAALGRVFGLPA